MAGRGGARPFRGPLSAGRRAPPAGSADLGALDLGAAPQGAHGAGDDLLDEFRRWLAVSSPALPPVLDVGRLEAPVGTHPAGSAYLVMELAPGTPVADLAPLGVATLLALLRDVAVALAALHQRHLQHRDVSPRNVLLVDAGAASRAMLIDLGHSRADGAAVRGTLGYMAPEALVGAADERSDLYALGAVAWFAVRVVSLGGTVVIALAAVLAQFDRTRPLLSRLGSSIGRPVLEGLEGALASVPGLVLAAVLLVLLRAALRFVSLILDGVATGRVKNGWIEPRRAPVARAVLSWLVVAVSLPLLVAAAFVRFLFETRSRELGVLRMCGWNAAGSAADPVITTLIRPCSGSSASQSGRKETIFS